MHTWTIERTKYKPQINQNLQASRKLLFSLEKEKRKPTLLSNDSTLKEKERATFSEIIEPQQNDGKDNKKFCDKISESLQRIRAKSFVLNKE